MLTEWRKSLDKKKTVLELLKSSEKAHKRRLTEYEKEQEILQSTREIFQKASLITQNHLAEHLSSIVTKAIRSVFFERKITFKVEFVERRNTTECDMYYEENGYKYPLLESRGYGVEDIASFALRVSYILLHTVDNILIIDEPFRNLSEDKHVFASQMIKELSKELDMKFLIATHVESLKEFADTVYKIKMENDISKSY